MPRDGGGQAVGSRESPEGLQDHAAPPCCLWPEARETTVHSQSDHVSLGKCRCPWQVSSQKPSDEVMFRF